jgi:hypothetical protein
METESCLGSSVDDGCSRRQVVGFTIAFKSYTLQPGRVFPVSSRSRATSLT